MQVRPSTLISSLCRCYGTIPWIYTHVALGHFLKCKKKMFFNSKFITTNSSHLQSFKFRQNLVWGSNKNSIFSSPWTENHEGYNYKVVAVKRNADAKFTPVCGLAISETLFFFLSLSHRAWQPTSFLSLFPRECSTFSSESKLYKAEKCSYNMWRCEKQEGR